jgi:endoglucanase
LVEGIRAESPDRLVIADGLSWGRIPVPALAALGIAQSTRGYDPFVISHWKADWVEGSSSWPKPTWPLPATPESIAGDRRQLAGLRKDYKDNPIIQHYKELADSESDWNRARLQRQLIKPWQELEAMGVGVHVGEFGAHNHTPHDVVLGWLRDLTGCWREAGWGWALWNLRGSFGVLDSERSDVKYESFRGHQLDRAFLELLRSA